MRHHARNRHVEASAPPEWDFAPSVLQRLCNAEIAISGGHDPRERRKTAFTGRLRALEGVAGGFLEVGLCHAVPGGDRFGRQVEHFLRRRLRIAPEGKLGNHRPPREVLAQVRKRHALMDGRTDNFGIAPHNLLPDVHLRVAGKGAGAALGKRSEGAAGREQHNKLLLVRDELEERIRAARLAGEVHL